MTISPNTSGNGPHSTTPSAHPSEDPSDPLPNRLVVGLTGGIGSGKSAATDWFITQGIDVIDADVIAHQIVAKGQPTLTQIQQQFGDWAITPSGELDRAAMRAHVFSDHEALKTLESITHPAVRAEAKRQLAIATSPYVILSAPLLLEGAEAGLASLCQRILVIDAPEHLQLARAGSRDQQSHDKIKAIMAKQLPRSHRVKQADDVVINDEDLEALYDKLASLHKTYLRLANH